MLTITAENVHDFIKTVRPLRANQETPSPIAKEVRDAVGCCCARANKLYLGPIKISGKNRPKELYACPCCKQLFEGNPHTEVRGTLDEYFTRLVEDHGSFQIILNSNAARLGVLAAHQ